MASGASANMQDKYRIMSFLLKQKMEILGWRVKGWRRCWSEAMFSGGSSRSSLASARIETLPEDVAFGGSCSQPRGAHSHQRELKLLLLLLVVEEEWTSRSSLASARIETSTLLEDG